MISGGANKRQAKLLKGAVILAIVGLLCALPFLLLRYYTGILILIFVWAIFTISWDLVGGYVGLHSLGHGAFAGTAAYTAAILSTQFNVNSVLAFVAGILAAALLAAIIGPVAVRTRGAYFLLLTLALAQVLWGTAYVWRSVTQGENGIPGIKPLGLGSWYLDSVTSFYFFCLVALALATFILFRITRSAFGLSLLGIREREARMTTIGYHVWLHKYIAFIVSGTIAGFAGLLFLHHNQFVSPELLHFATSAEALLMGMVGGSGFLFGPIIGAAAVVLLKNFISAYTSHWLVVYGAIFIIVALFAPQGIMGPLLRLWKRQGK